ncbi:hypothetical protein HGRIS_002260 [Hohenbuehelia grisea]|uniref:Pheromone receptor n=1 Tax=Hohenbuehelia grisea TaxID=104357 RepID=A0ABR3JKP4_9AGAR
MTYPNQVYSTFAFIGFLLVCIPLPWHLEAWNTGTCLYMIWTGLACLIQFVNSMIWTGNTIDWAPVWCDITTRILIAVPVAIPAASLCINRRLYKISKVTIVSTTKTDRRRAIMVDLAIGLGLPFAEMILQYVVQGHRYDILEDFGCITFTVLTPLAFVLVWAVPLAIGLGSGVYCVLSIRAFRQRQSELKEFSSSLPNLTRTRYLRLMALAGMEAALTVPLSVATIVTNALQGRGTMVPYGSWADLHFGFSRVKKYPAVLWRSTQVGNFAVEGTRWSVVLCAIVFFAFFGFADEARRNYSAAWKFIACRFPGRKPGTTLQGSTRINTSQASKSFACKGLDSDMSQTPLPIYNIHRKAGMETPSKRDSLDSISDILSTISDDSDAYSVDLADDPPIHNITISSPRSSALADDGHSRRKPSLSLLNRVSLSGLTLAEDGGSPVFSATTPVFAHPPDTPPLPPQLLLAQPPRAPDLRLSPIPSFRRSVAAESTASIWSCSSAAASFLTGDSALHDEGPSLLAYAYEKSLPPFPTSPVSSFQSLSAHCGSTRDVGQANRASFALSVPVIAPSAISRATTPRPRPPPLPLEQSKIDGSRSSSRAANADNSFLDMVTPMTARTFGR